MKDPVITGSFNEENMKSLYKKNRSLGLIFILGISILMIFAIFGHGKNVKVANVTENSGVIIPMDEQMTTTQIMASLELEKIGLPVRIKIPLLAVDTEFVRVGLTASGEMDIPKGPTEVAWYELGPRPGEVGSSVVAGHFGWKDGIPAVFDHLDKLHKGDKIYIENENGTTTTFIVRETRTFGENDDASEVFVSGDGIAHLNLVTCQGVWNKNNKSYSERFVVFADKVTE